jgi:hypothetical protein
LAFVVGTGRCGSTFVAELIARHPEVGFISNVDESLPKRDLVGRWNNALFARAPERDPSLRALPPPAPGAGAGTAPGRAVGGLVAAGAVPKSSSSWPVTAGASRLVRSHGACHLGHVWPDIGPPTSVT